MVEGNKSLDEQGIEVPESLGLLVDWYGDYAKEVVINRAIPAIDGFKPSQRRILYAMKFMEKVKDFRTSQSVVGTVVKIHPHGDASAYSTMVRMVEQTNNMTIPFIEGEGSFGEVRSDDAPAAMRYTSVRFAPVADEIFQDMNGVDFITSENAEYKEPVVLPTKFPNIAVNPYSGIAVGLACDKPPFNFNEVNEATIELIKTGDISKPLVPDYPTGGNYVYNEKELNKLMTTGRASIKVRGSWYVEGSHIIITDIPYSTKINTVIRQIKEIKGVTEAKDLDDFDGLKIAVKCSNRRVVDQVLHEILRVTDLQMNLRSNIVVISNNEPLFLGMKGLIQEWVNFRKSVLERTIPIELKKVELTLKRHRLFQDLVNDETKRIPFTDALVKKGEAEGLKMLREWYPDQEMDVYGWVLDRKLKDFSSYKRGGGIVANLEGQVASLKDDLNNITGVIIRELEEMNRKYVTPRRTKITHEDYVFDKPDQTVVKAEPTVVKVVIEGKFIKKLRDDRMNQDVNGLMCMSNDVFSFIDTQGRLLRVDLDKIPTNDRNDRGTYLPLYIEVEDDFDVVAYEKIANVKKSYLYSDGYASVLDYSEWVNAEKLTRMTQKGVSPLSSLIMSEIDLDTAYVMVVSEKGRFGFFSTDFKQKNRTARTKVIDVPKDDKIVYSVPVAYADILQLVSSPQRFLGKLRVLSEDDNFNEGYYNSLTGGN